MIKLFEMLKKEHREVESILEKMQEDKSNRKKLFDELKRELQPHLKAEEKVLYPALMQKEEVRSETLESIVEHHVTELLFREMVRMSMDDERWSAKLKVLDELIQHHIREEEGKLFTLAQQNFDSAMFDEIMPRFQQERERVKRNIK